MQQIILSGIGGQGVLFVTRLLAEAALELGLSVLISETHGMAQRGGNVISHLKVGHSGPTGPLIRPGRADLFLGLHPDSFGVHGFFLKPGGTAFCNGPPSAGILSIDASRKARELGSPVTANLVLLGFAAASETLFCRPKDILSQLERDGTRRGQIAVRAFRMGLEAWQELREAPTPPSALPGT